jgi:hypothetical protein
MMAAHTLVCTVEETDADSRGMGNAGYTLTEESD